MTSPATPLIGCRENRYWSERTSFTGRPTAREAAVEGTSIAFSSLSLLFFLYYCLPSALCLPCSLSLTAPLPPSSPPLPESLRPPHSLPPFGPLSFPPLPPPTFVAAVAARCLCCSRAPGIRRISTRRLEFRAWNE